MPGANIVRARLLVWIGGVLRHLSGTIAHNHKPGISRNLCKLGNTERLGLVDWGPGLNVGVVLLAAHSELADCVLEEELTVDFVGTHGEAVVVLLGACVEGVVVGALGSHPAAQPINKQSHGKQICLISQGSS